jgi:asparagine synthetase B (glutamine-hydrolysing)
MCGIFAAVGKPPTDAGLQNVFAALHHRGPDGRGVFRDEAASVAIAQLFATEAEAPDPVVMAANDPSAQEVRPPELAHLA